MTIIDVTQQFPAVGRDGASPARLVSKGLDSFTVTDSRGDMSGDQDGFYVAGTRMVSQWQLLLADTPPLLLSGTTSVDDMYFVAQLSNCRLCGSAGETLKRNTLGIERRRFLAGDRLYERVRLRWHGAAPVRLPVSLHFAADFRDIFEVRGWQRERRGEVLAPRIDEQSICLGYHGLDDVRRDVHLAFSSRPERLLSDQAHFAPVLGPGEKWTLYIEIGVGIDREVAAVSPNAARWRRAAAEARRVLRARRQRGAALRAHGRAYDAWLDRSRADLALLTSELSSGPYPFAGIPWFSTAFGRDAVITALQTLWFDPALARGVLSFLARTQAQEDDASRDAERGKIVHETRRGEMARLRETPFEQYYGGVDTTPLFVMLAAQHDTRTADTAFTDSIWPALSAATAWIERRLDAHPLGLLDYARGARSGLANQGWKDSDDSVFHADGSDPQGAIALVEVQGYAYRALCDMAALAKRRGDTGQASAWQRRAESLRASVEQHFWDETADFYVLALDGDRQPCRVRASNAGHLLYAGLPEIQRAAAVTRQLLAADFDSGWGIRTLAEDAVRFNPMSYHNGSVWPHDVALCAAGMAHYGERAGVARLLGALHDAAVALDLRLPELFCGDARRPGEAPVRYPVACLPQAWAAGAVFMMLQACLGLSIDAAECCIRVRRPCLPQGLQQLDVRGLTIAGQQVDLRFTQADSGTAVQILQQSGGAPVRLAFEN